MYNSTAEALRVDTNDSEYIRGYMDAMKKQHKRERERRRRKLYFLEQKAIGAAVLIGTAFAVKLLDGDATIALLTVPMGIMLIFTREMWIDNEYYREVEERKLRRCQRR